MFDILLIGAVIIGLLVLMVTVGCVFEIREYLKYRKTVKQISKARHALNKDQRKYFTDLKED